MFYIYWTAGSVLSYDVKENTIDRVENTSLFNIGLRKWTSQVIKVLNLHFSIDQKCF